MNIIADIEDISIFQELSTDRSNELQHQMATLY